MRETQFQCCFFFVLFQTRFGLGVVRQWSCKTLHLLRVATRFGRKRWNRSIVAVLNFQCAGCSEPSFALKQSVSAGFARRSIFSYQVLAHTCAPECTQFVQFSVWALVHDLDRFLYTAIMLHNRSRSAGAMSAPTRCSRLAFAARVVIRFICFSIRSLHYGHIVRAWAAQLHVSPAW